MHKKTSLEDSEPLEESVEEGDVPETLSQPALPEDFQGEESNEEKDINEEDHVDNASDEEVVKEQDGERDNWNGEDEENPTTTENSSSSLRAVVHEKTKSGVGNDDSLELSITPKKKNSNTTELVSNVEKGKFKSDERNEENSKSSKKKPSFCAPSKPKFSVPKEKIKEPLNGTETKKHKKKMVKKKNADQTDNADKDGQKLKRKEKEPKNEKVTKQLTDEQWNAIFAAVLQPSATHGENQESNVLTAHHCHADDFEAVLKEADDTEHTFIDLHPHYDNSIEDGIDCQKDDETDHSLVVNDVPLRGDNEDAGGISDQDGGIDDLPDVDGLEEMAAADEVLFDNNDQPVEQGVEFVDIDELDDAIRIEFIRNANESSPVVSYCKGPSSDEKKNSGKKSLKPVDKLNKLAPKQLDFSHGKNKKKKHQTLKDEKTENKTKKSKHSTKNKISKKDKLLGRDIEEPGTWVQCDDCHRWRNLLDIHDPSILPDKWMCSMNTDEKTENKTKKSKHSTKNKISKKDKLLGRDIEEPGTWVQCDDCHRWRNLLDIHDPSILPDKWMCSMNTDDAYNSCDKPEQEYDGLYDEDNFVYTSFTEGSLVWARMAGYPWWPGIIDIDPDLDSFIHFDAYDEKDQYHVVFFGDKVSRSWLKPNFLRRFTGEDINTFGPVKMKGHDYKKELKRAKSDATSALELSLKDRLKKYGFASRYTGRYIEDDASQGTSTHKKKIKKEPSKIMNDEDALDVQASSEDETNLCASGIIRDWHDVYSDDEDYAIPNTHMKKKKEKKMHKSKKEEKNKLDTRKEKRVEIDGDCDLPETPVKKKEKRKHKSREEKFDKEKRKAEKTKDQLLSKEQKKEKKLKKIKVFSSPVDKSNSYKKLKPLTSEVKKPCFTAPKKPSSTKITERSDTSTKHNSLDVIDKSTVDKPALDSEIFTMEMGSISETEVESMPALEDLILDLGKEIQETTVDSSKEVGKNTNDESSSEMAKINGKTKHPKPKCEDQKNDAKLEKSKKKSLKHKCNDKESGKIVKAFKKPKFAAPLVKGSSKDNDSESGHKTEVDVLLDDDHEAANGFVEKVPGLEATATTLDEGPPENVQGTKRKDCESPFLQVESKKGRKEDEIDNDNEFELLEENALELLPEESAISKIAEIQGDEDSEPFEMEE